MTDFNKEVKKLYSSNNKFFIKIRRKKKGSNPYWKEKVLDPDGKVRKRFSKLERLKFFQNNADIIKKINKLKIKKVLDVGCGNGFMLSYLNKKFNKFGIDNDDLAIEHAKKFADIRKADLNKGIKINKKFDLIILYHVIEHLEEPINFLKQIIKKNLSKGGYLVIGTPDFDSAMARRYKNNFRLLHDQTHISLFSFYSLCNFFKTVNLKIIDVHFPYFETSYFNMNELKKLAKLNKKVYSPPFYGNVVNFILKK